MYNLSNCGINSTHSIEPELQYFSTLSMKTAQPTASKWVSLDKTNAKVISRSSSYDKVGIFQTASNAASESSHYCNNFYPAQKLDQNAALNQSSQYQYMFAHNDRDRRQQKQNIEDKALNRNIYRKYNQSELPPTHYHSIGSSQLSHYSNNNLNNNNIDNNDEDNNDNQFDLQSKWKQRFTNFQQSTVEQQPLLLLDANNSYSNTTDKHCEHYYSYYDRQPARKPFISTGRKLPDTFMETNRKNIGAINHGRMSTANLMFSDQLDLHSNELLPPQVSLHKHESLHDHHHVLKEKISNNNVVKNPPCGGHDEWSNSISNVELVGLANDFMDVKDMDAYEDELNLIYGADSKLLRNKHQLHTCVEAIQCNGKNNNSWMDDKKCGSNTTIHNKILEHKKLPTTPQRSQGKKYPPLTHKVLHYGNQSPRLQRLSPRHSTRSKSPALTIQNKSSSHRSISDGNNTKEIIDCYSNVLKSFAPVATPILAGKGRKSTYPTHEERELDNTSHVNDADSATDSENNAVDDDDDNDDDIDELDNVSGANDSSDTDATSDSEDGYRVYAYKLTHSMERVSFVQSNLSSEATEDELLSPSSVLVPSLFPNVPPYLAFSSNKQKGPDVPIELQRVLKWRVTNVMPKVVRCILANSGMRLLKKTNDWMGIWGKHMKSPCFKTIRPYQKMNHLPGSFKIGRKDSCWKNLFKQMNKHGKKEFGFMPKTYIIPHDLNLLRKHWPKYAQRNVKWIIKPPASARGTGIRVVDRWAQIPKRKPLIVQKYIERPLLINGSKFDLRLYVLVTSINPLRVFMYHNGLARFASVKYSNRADTLNDRCMHLTNYSINKFSSNYAKNEDVNACHGHKWTIKSLWSYLANRGIHTDCLWEALRNLVLRTILAGEQSINNMIRMNMESKYSCFELFGFDVLLDADLIPWLLEVNISPSLHSELPLDAHVKAPLVQGVLNTALFQVPPKLSHETQKQIVAQLQLPAGSLCYDKRLYINYLSRAEKIKHTTFTRKSLEDRDEYIDAILDNLTPDDIRCLIIAEDELARSAPLERIFPTNQTYKYLKYTESPRYYNRLLDAWETRYSNNRPKGIALLRQYCEEKYHLEVPPSPAKKLLKRRTRALILPRTSWTLLRSSVMLTSRKNSQIYGTNSNYLRNTPNYNLHKFQTSSSSSASSLLSSSSSSSSSLTDGLDRVEQCRSLQESNLSTERNMKETETAK